LIWSDFQTRLLRRFADFAASIKKGEQELKKEKQFQTINFIR